MTNKSNIYPLFEDTEDKALQARNRASIILNIMEDNSKDGKVSLKGTSLVIKYMKDIPEGERKLAFDETVRIGKLRGVIKNG